MDWMAQRRNRAQTLPAHLVTGMQGEDAAYFHLRRKGYIVAARRWSPGHEPGDIDLIAWQGPLLCVVEVKTRTAHDATPAEVAVDSQQAHDATPPGTPVCSPVTAADCAAGPVRCDQCVSCAGAEEGIFALRKRLRLERLAGSELSKGSFALIVFRSTLYNSKCATHPRCALNHRRSK